ncbi:NADH:ubiquinone oxidoreductase subunit L [Kordiimonas sediminis]|uniref:NADH-ubiquinone oxidoreductase chain 5 n=1 Tax=Kordiimonas sediminis TaxID=1735581 RepID=A0A919AVJ8_9PROT|nr:NADH-quinone oxidoreductase subunit L [Kordiimonas sediminis]GHF28642.1 NADH:ubiquinone oxidoreductase subunit L [Kordiimonas sediminis]
MMYKLIVFLPLIGFLFAGLFGSKFSDRISQLVTAGLVTVSAVLSWMAFADVALGGNQYTVLVLEWVSSGALSFDWAFKIDTLTVVMLVVVNSVSALVHWYSFGYMEDDPSKPRFFGYLSLFTFAMLMLVTSDNLVQMFFGWEGVGLASYLLIGYYYKKPSANAAAIKAFVVNRVGDFGFSLGIFGAFALFGSVMFDDIFASADQYADYYINFLGTDFHAITVICILLFVGAMGKSAQLGLHTWLPDAMEGPTPVSALIHAATMVTAGVFLVARFSPVFEMSPTALAVVTIIGATTAFFAATVGLVQNDIKRVIAYSTCSQLGYMFFALGVSAYGAAIFHLFTHAFFKALLFLGSGAVIHAMHHEQDMRNYGGLAKKIPFTFAMMTIGTIALTGFPGTAGFYSKDMILEAAYASHAFGAQYAFVLGIAAAFMTSFYSWRLAHLTFFNGECRADEHTASHAHEAPWIMRLPLVILAVGALFAGVVFADMFVGEGRFAFWNGALVTSVGDVLDEAHHVPFAVKAAPFVVMLLGFIFATVMYYKVTDIPERMAKTWDGLYAFLLNKWYFDELFNFIFIRPAFWLGRVFWKKGDEATIDGFGPNGVSHAIAFVAARARKLQTGYVYHYAFAMIIGLSLAITWFMVTGSSH